MVAKKEIISFLFFPVLPVLKETKSLSRTHGHLCLHVCVNSFSPHSLKKNPMITNGQMAKIRLLWFGWISAFEPSLLEEVPTVTAHVSPPPPDLCKPTRVLVGCWQPPTQTFSSGWPCWLASSVLSHSTALSSPFAHLLGPRQPPLHLQTSNVLCLEPE